MTDNEVIVIIFGLAVGYWLVAKLINIDSSSNNKGFSNDDGFSHKTESRDNLEEKQWFNVLEVSQVATKEQIAKAYKEKISQYHPDKVAKMGSEIRELAELKSKEINAAYDYALKSRR